MGNILKSICTSIDNLLFKKPEPHDNTIFPPTPYNNPFSVKFQNNAFWCEWWTLYLYEDVKKSDTESKTGLCGMINYIFIKGLNEFGVAVMYPAFVHNGKKYNSKNIFSLRHFSSTDTQVNITDSNKIIKNDTSYHFIGETNDKKMSWDLEIIKQLHPINVAQNLGFGVNSIIKLPVLEKISFVSMVPHGSVEGKITIDGTTYVVKQHGEAEHIWGPVLLPTINWNLFFGSNPKNDLVYCLHLPSTSSTEEKGAIYLLLEGQVKIIRDYSLSELYDSRYNYPTRIFISARHDDIKITVNIVSISAAEATDPSENQVSIEVLYNGKQYMLAGMSEYYRANFGDLLKSTNIVN